MTPGKDPVYLRAIYFIQDVATRKHALSKLIPPLLLLLDAALCMVVIAKVACK